MRRLGLILILLTLVLGSVWMYQRFQRPAPRKALWQNVPDDAALWFYAPSFAQLWKNLRTHPLWQVWQRSPHLKESYELARSWDSLLQENQRLFEWLGDRAIQVSFHLEGQRWVALYLIEAPFLAQIGDWRTEMAQLAQRFGWPLKLVEVEGYALWRISEGYLVPAGQFLAYSESPKLLIRFLQGKETANPPWDWGGSPWETSRPWLYIGWNGPRLAQLLANPALTALATLQWGSLEVRPLDEGLSLRGQCWPNDTLWANLRTLNYNPFDLPLPATYVLTAFSFQNPSAYYDTYLYPRWEKEIQTAENWLDLSFRKLFIEALTGDIVFLAQPSPLLLLKLRDPAEFEKGLDLLHKRLRRRSPFKDRPRSYRGYAIHHLEVKGFFRWLLGRYFQNWQAPYLAIQGEWVGIAQEPQVLETWLDANLSQHLLSERLTWYAKAAPEQTLVTVYLGVHPTQWLKAFIPEAQAQARWRAELEPWDNLQLALRPASSKHLEAELTIRLRTSEGIPTENPPLEAFRPATPPSAQPEDSLQETLEEEYYPNGVLKKRAIRIRALLEGEYVEYHPNGTLKVQGYYEQGQKVGTWRYYDQNGQLLREETWSVESP